MEQRPVGRAHGAFFYRADDDLVDWTFRRGVTARSANEVDIDTTGFEFVAQRSWTAVDLVLGYTWLTKDADYKGATVDASFYALNYARHRFTAAIVARMSSEFEFRMDNEVRFQADNFLRTSGGDEAILSSLGLTYRPASLAPAFVHRADRQSVGLRFSGCACRASRAASNICHHALRVVTFCGLTSVRARTVFRDMALNPFLDSSFHIRWSALRADQIEPGISEALARAQTAVDAIASRTHWTT